MVVLWWDIRHSFNVTESPPGNWVWWGGRGLVGGSFFFFFSTAISGGDTMKVTRQKDLIAPLLSLATWADYLAFTATPPEGPPTSRNSRPHPFFSPHISAPLFPPQGC